MTNTSVLIMWAACIATGTLLGAYAGVTGMAECTYLEVVR